MKKTILFILPVAAIAVIVGGVSWLYRTPFEQKYALAVQQAGHGQYREALPVLKKALDVYSREPGQRGRLADATYQYARCQSALDPKDTACWQAVVAVHTARAVLAVARLNLAQASPNRDEALAAFAAEFPEQPAARQYLLASANRALASKDTAGARKMLQSLADNQPGTPETASALKSLGDLNMAELCSPRPLPFTTNHVVAQGEYIATIAHKYHVYPEAIKRVNNLKTDVITRGVKLKIDLSRYCIKVDISDKILYLYRIAGGATNFVKCYPAGTGKLDNTPRGSFAVTSREKNPTWYRPGGAPVSFGSKDNLLGTRWLGISAQGFGIHGTWEPDTVGKASSAGCIRMLNEDVEELFDLVRLDTPVLIKD